MICEKTDLFLSLDSLNLQ